MDEFQDYTVLGLMSGSSLDGLDLALCQFSIPKHHPAFAPIPSWELISATTVALPPNWTERLKNLPSASALQLAQAHHDFGHWLGKQCYDFLRDSPLKPDLIASHGHTIFHSPATQLTTQIGDGAALAVESQYPVICDFRTTDIALGGQGAPLAPTADRMLFPDFAYCMNIGGIANISGGKLAYDIGPANQIWNALAALVGQPYDLDGKLARKGQLLSDLMEQVNNLPYFRQSPPKSLGNRWVREVVWPLYDNYPASVEDRLHTAVHQLVEQTATDLQRWHPPQPQQRILLTGGGAYHQYFVEQLQKKLSQRFGMEVVVPEPAFIDYKEAILIALLGALRWCQQPNVMATLTGARVNSCSGAIYLPPSTS